MKPLIALMRPKQWVKNVFVFAPLVFTGTFTQIEAIFSSFLTFVYFCIASSVTYIINDLNDIEADRKHPIKSQKRPLASGAINPSSAKSLMIFLIAIFSTSYFTITPVFYVISGYIALMILYTFTLKHQPIIDIFVIAIGFVIRVFAGAAALNVPVSSWMFVTTLCLALYLASVKRKQELTSISDKSRKVLEHYNVTLIDRYAEISATGALVFYSLYVMESKPELVITIPLVLYGLFRYWYIVEKLNGGESPTDVLFSDWQLAVVAIIWAIASSVVMMN
jgi:decaprenyl-phosphate phosphoribosyltransferase